MSSIRIEVAGDKERLLRRLQTMAGIDLKGVNQSIAEGLRTSTIERFRAEKGPDEKKWKTSMRAGATGGKTLTHTSKLKNSIHSEASEYGLAVGTNDIKAATHQFGDTRTIKPKKGPVLRFQVGGKWVSAKQVRVTIPARPFLGISDDDDAEITETLMQVLEEQ